MKAALLSLLFLGLATCSQTIVDITLENQMKIFMDQHNIIGEWLAYFEDIKTCKEACLAARAEIASLSQILKGKPRIAKINW